jgi:Cu/Ag efflux pump CusA
LLLLVDYLLVAILIFASLNALGQVALVLGTVPMAIYTGAEALHGFRPTQDALATADRLALIAVGSAFTIALIVSGSD